MTMKSLWHSRFGRTLLTLLLVGASLALWAFVIEPARLVVRQYVLPIPALPAQLRVAALSDLHVGAPHITLAKLRQIVALTNAAQPDLILLLGDYVIQNVIGGSFVEPSAIAAELSNLRAPLGVYAVLGNHDHWHNAAQISRALSNAGIHMLDDQTQRLEFRGQPFWLMGLGDEWNAKSDVAQVLAHITDAAPIIVLTHNPDIFVRIPPRVILTLAGHTHGGQCAFPLIGRPIVPSIYGERFAIGHVYENDHHLFVTPGIGTSILPVRFRVVPEISILSLSEN